MDPTRKQPTGSDPSVTNTRQPTRVRVLAADSCSIYLDGLVRAITRWPELQLVRTAQDRSVLDALAQRDTDVALIYPAGLGCEHEELLEAAADGPRVVFLGTHKTDGAEIYRAIELGVYGYLSKESEGHEICQSILAVARGKDVISRAFQVPLVDELKFRGLRKRLGPHLTQRQQQVVELLAQGLQISEIAEELVLAESTVKTHLRNLYSALEVGSGAAAVARAMRTGLIE